MQRLLSALLALPLLSLSTSAQFADHHASLRGAVLLAASSNHADVWGEGDYAFVGRFLQNAVDIVDVSDASNPALVATWTVPSPNGSASAQDVKVANGLMFIALEYNDPHGVEIVDVRDPLNPAHLTWIDTEPGEFEEIHNVYYLDGWLYLDNSSDNTVSILDLRTYNPDAAPAEILTWTHRLDNVGDTFVHDITVAGDLLFCAAWDSLYVYDIANIATSAPTLLTTTPGLSCHSVWPTEDGQFVVTAAERQAGGMRLYEIMGSGASRTLVQRDSWVEPLSSAFCVHNPVIKNDRIYASYYQAGAIVLEIDRASKTLMEVARYDTNAINGFTGSFGTSFGGAWGIYPLAGESRTLITDFGSGLSVVDFSGLSFQFMSGRPQDFVAGETTEIVVEVRELDATLASGSVSLALSVDGRPFVALPMTSIGGGEFSVTLPPFNRSSRVRWYVRASDTQGRIFQHPTSAPSVTHSGVVADSKSTAFADNFESNLGWTVVDAPTGSWIRDTPIPFYSQPDGGAPDAAGTQAFVTGNFGPAAGTDDIDDGETVLTSPSFSLSGSDGRVSYDRWFFCDDADTDDELIVEISANNGPWVLVSETELQAGGWVRESFVISDFVSPAGNLRVRFRADDDPNNSITDAAIDSVLVESFDTLPGLVFSIDPTQANGSSRWRMTGGAGAEFVVVGYSLAGAGVGPCLFGGNLCLDLLFPITILTSGLSDGDGTFETTITAPMGSTGVSVAGQAVVLRGVGLVDSVASNAAQITIQ